MGQNESMKDNRDSSRDFSNLNKFYEIQKFSKDLSMDWSEDHHLFLDSQGKHRIPTSSEMLKVADFNLLHLFVSESKAHQASKSDLDHDHSLCLERMDFKLFMENFTDNSKEYTYRNWNHLSSRKNLQFPESEIKNKKPVTSMDFTEKEKQAKQLLDKLPMYKLGRTACLDYYFDSENCFSSFGDVIDVTKRQIGIKTEACEEEVPTNKMHFTPRVFDKQTDSLHQKGEFPRETHHRQYEKEELVSYLKGSCIESKRKEKKLKVRRLKNQVRKTLRKIKSRLFLPLKESGHKNLLVQQTFSHQTEFLLRSKSLRSNATISRDLISITDLSEKFLFDFNEIESNQVKPEEVTKNEDEIQLEPEEWFEGILELEQNRSTIDCLNWSGEQVQELTKFTRKRVKLALHSLNDQDLIIWMSGFKGFLVSCRKKLKKFIVHPVTEKILIMCVITNTLFLTLDGIVTNEAGFYLVTFNSYFTFVFLFAFLSRLIAHGPKIYLRNAFNVFDGLVVTLSMIELTINFSYNNSSGGSALSAIRALRIFRIFKVLRLTRIVKTLKFMIVIIEVIVETLLQYAYVTVVLLMFLITYSIIGLQVYQGQVYINGEVPRLNFNDLSSSCLSLFQIITLDSWIDLVEPLYKSSVNSTFTVFYVTSWIFIGHFIFLNLFLALLLGGFESKGVLKSIEEMQDQYLDIEERLKSLKKQRELKRKELVQKSKQDRTKLMYIVSTENKENIGEDEVMLEALDEEKRRTRATYFFPENHFDSESSLDDMLYHTIDQKIREEKKQKKKTGKYSEESLYKDVHCASSLNLFAKNNPVRKFAARLVSHKLFEPVIITLILSSTIKLVAVTYISRNNNSLNLAFTVFDNCITVCFVFEAILKILRNGLVEDENSYFKEPWNIVDFIIVLCSCVDSIFSNISIPGIKVVRTLRPLRFVSHHRNMRVIVNSLAKVFAPLLNVLLVFIIIWTIFSILAMNFVGGMLGYCEDPSNYGISKGECDIRGMTWKRAYWNFDNIGESMVTLFVVFTLEGWSRVVMTSIDAGDSPTSGPIYNNNVYMWLYFLSFILVSSFFLFDLFVGVIFYHYGQELDKAISTDCKGATSEQINWIMMQRMIFKSHSNFKLIDPPKSKLRKAFFSLMTSKVYEFCMFFAIIVNLIVLGMDFEGSSDLYTDVLGHINNAFSFVFLVEMIFKLIAFKSHYFKDNWNLLDFLIVVLSMIDFVLDLTFVNGTSRVKKLQFAKVLRTIRIVRLVKLFKNPQMTAFKKLLNTLVFSLPTILNVLALLFLTYCIFAVMACFIFLDAKIPASLSDKMVSFENFHLALITLFRCSTGEDWPIIMYTYGDTEDNYTYARLFFISFILITTLIMLNLLDLVVVSIFENFYFDPDNALTHFKQIAVEFNKTWNAFTIKEKGKRIHYLSLPRFFATLKEPLGFRVNNDDEDLNEIEDIITNQNIFAIRKPYLSIVLLLSLLDLPM